MNTFDIAVNFSFHYGWIQSAFAFFAGCSITLAFVLASKDASSKDNPVATLFMIFGMVLLIAAAEVSK